MSIQPGIVPKNGMTIGNCSICGTTTINGSCADSNCRSHYVKTQQQWGHIPTGQVASGPLTAAQVLMSQDSRPSTLEEWKKQQWDSAIYKSELLTPRERKMVYYYLNKSGVSMSNLDHDIDKDLNKQYNSEHPKKAW